MTYHRILWLFYSCNFSVLIIFLILGLSLDYSVRQLFEDPAKGHRLLGIFTYLGALFWSFTSAICVFSSVLIKYSGNEKIFRFTALAGAFSLFLLFDDLFLFHEWMQSNVRSIGENGIFALYGVFLCSYLLHFRSVILASEFSLLFVALAFFATSLLIDTVIEPWLWRLGGWSLSVEDIPKILGIFSWFAYFSRFCYLACIKAYPGTISRSTCG